MQVWTDIDLEDLVRILTLPKFGNLEQLKNAVRSVIIDLHYDRFQREYNQHSTGMRCALYRELIATGNLSENLKSLPSELDLLEEMRIKKSFVKKTMTTNDV
ncbi:unnamed protein product [Gongylonema pulchrum]|uniref:Uncharacterized protein n=1 Tax=Gongylonema pulchrum TaxID=637853 RepID=A0A3P7SB91_9BILA|nr:unnamed protein product [Gongylonema pulchrum]